MRTPFFLVLISLAAAFSTGCAYSPQTVRLAPATLIAPSDRGHGVSVSVSVTDERPSQKIGQRSDAYGMGAEIRSDDNIAAIVADEINRGLLAKGFQTAAGSGSAAKLIVEVRLLEYDTSTGFFTGGVHLRSAVKARATAGTLTYEKLYRSEKEERVAVVPTAETNAAWINRSLSEVLQQLFSDDALLDFLAAAK